MGFGTIGKSMAGTAERFMAGTAEKFMAAAVTLLLAAGCASGPSLGGLGGGVNYASASSLSDRMREGDVRALSGVFVEAMENAAPFQPLSWNGETARGTVTPGNFTLGNLTADPSERFAFPPGLETNRTFETEQGDYVLIRNSNVRMGPSTDYPVITKASSGTGVEVLGKVVGETWMLISVENRIRGYVFESLLMKAPGTELDLAGGPTKTPQICRTFKQRIAAYGESDEWDGAACKTDRGWEVDALPENAPTRLY